MSKFNCFLCHQDMNGDPITKEEIDYIKEKIKSLETNLALSEKKLDRAMKELNTVVNFAEIILGDKDMEHTIRSVIKEIEEME